jgi:hypothetical protein
MPAGGGVTDADLASVREAQEEMMPETVTLLERAEVKDGRGGTKVTWTARSQTVSGRVGTVRDNMRLAYAGQLRGKATAVLTIPVGSPLKELDRVHVLNADYNVVADLSKSSYATAARYLIEEV